MKLDIDAAVSVRLVRCEARFLAPDSALAAHPEDGSPWCWRGRVDLRFTIGQATTTKRIVAYGRPPWPKGCDAPTAAESLATLADMDREARHRIERHGITVPEALPWRVFVGPYDDATECHPTPVEAPT